MRIIFIGIAVIWATGLFSQNKQLIYGVKEIPQSLLVNPGGIVEQKYHFGIPFLSQFHINGGSSGVSVYDIFQESESDINDRISNALYEMDNKDFFTSTQQLELINFGKGVFATSLSKTGLSLARRVFEQDRHWAAMCGHSDSLYVLY